MSGDILVGLISPDERGRFGLRKWASRDPSVTGWLVFVDEQGDSLRLEAVRGSTDERSGG